MIKIEVLLKVKYTFMSIGLSNIYFRFSRLELKNKVLKVV